MRKFEAGKYISQGSYKAFEPTPIHHEWNIDMEIVTLLSQADRHLGRLDMYSEYVNIDLFIRMHIAKEATQSTKIEGTQTNMEDAFLEQSEISEAKKNDWVEVQNYIKGMNVAVDLLHSLPFSSRLIKEAHRVLLQGVRGEHKLPGEYRRSQNWIGGATLNDAVFIPPAFTSLPELMSDMEKFANDEELNVPDLIKIAIIHYQFETIHPFLDGNGRVGRLLITLYLVSKGILKRPILYLSDFFERNKTLYYDNLMNVRIKNDINQWIKFFLAGIIETAKNGIKTFDGILQLQKELDCKINSMGSRGIDAKKVIDYMYGQPIINVDRVQDLIDKKSATAYRLLDLLEEKKIIVEITGSQRNKLFVFDEYLKLFD